MISRYKKCILDGSVRVVEGIIARKHITLEVQREYEQLTQLYELLARHEMSMEDDSLFTIFILSDGTVRVHADQMVTLKEQCDLVHGALRWDCTFLTVHNVIDARPASCTTFRQILQWLERDKPLVLSFQSLPPGLDRLLTDADFMGCPLVTDRVRAFLTDMVLNGELPATMWWSSIPVVWAHICTYMIPPPALEVVFNVKLQTMFDQALTRDTDECLQQCKSAWLRSTPVLHLGMLLSLCNSPIARKAAILEMFHLIPKLALDVLLSKPQHHDLAMECLQLYPQVLWGSDATSPPFLKTALTTGCATANMVQKLLSAGCSPWAPMDTLPHCLPLVVDMDVVKALLLAASDVYNSDASLDIDIELYQLADAGAKYPHTWELLTQFYDRLRNVSSQQRSSLHVHFAVECLIALNAVNNQVITVVLGTLSPAECNEVLNSLMGSYLHTSEDMMDLASELMHYLQQRADMACACTNARHMLGVVMRQNRLQHLDRDDLEACMYLAKDINAQALKYAAVHGTMRVLYTVLGKFKPSTASISAAIMHAIKLVPCTHTDAWRIKALLEKGQSLLAFTAKAPKGLLYRLLLYDKHCILTQVICRTFFEDKELSRVGMPLTAIPNLAPIIGGGCMAYRTAHRYARLVIGNTAAAATLMCRLGGVQSSNEWLIKLCVRRGAVLDDGMLREAIQTQDVDIAQYIATEGKLCVTPDTFCLTLHRPEQLPMADMLYCMGGGKQLLESEVVQAHFKHHDDPFIPYLFNTFLLRQQAQ